MVLKTAIEAFEGQKPNLLSRDCITGDIPWVFQKLPEQLFFKEHVGKVSMKKLNKLLFYKSNFIERKV